MDSESLLGWADLPPEIISRISDFLQNPDDVTRFRWICRSWRLSTSPPNKISRLFPRILSSTKNLTINASAIYLLRPKSDPSKAWLVSLQESVAGKLVPRHALTYSEITSPGSNLDFSASSEFWSSVTQVSKTYAINGFCKKCSRVSSMHNLELVPDVHGFCPTKLLGLSNLDEYRMHLFGFSIGRLGSRLVGYDEYWCYKIEDFVKFDGRIFAIDQWGQIFVYDARRVKLHKINYGEELSGLLYWDNNNRRFVVSEGGLYVVTTSYDRCRVYRLVVDEVDLIIKSRNQIGGWVLNAIRRGGKIMGWEEIKDLGERVFFIAKNCSFSVSVHDLPNPWRSNCVVFVDELEYKPSLCDCDPSSKQIRVFHLGGDNPQVELISALEGYSDLFDPPLSSIDDQLKKDFARKENCLSNWLA